MRAVLSIPLYCVFILHVLLIVSITYTTSLCVRFPTIGTTEAQKYCLRAKIDMASLNGTMRDPVLYR